MKIKFCLALALAVPLCVAPLGAAPVRKAGGAAPSYTAKADGYALWLPSRPQQQVKKVSIPGMGSMSVRFIALPPSPVAYAVVPTPVPRGYTTARANQMLDGIVQGFSQSSGGRLISKKRIKLGSFPGLEVVMTMGKQAPGAQMRGRFIVTPKRSFQIMALGRPEQLAAKKAQVDKVLDSFQVL